MGYCEDSHLVGYSIGGDANGFLRLDTPIVRVLKEVSKTWRRRVDRALFHIS